MSSPWRHERGIDMLPTMDLLIVGGTRAHPGGVEQFCARATTAMSAVGGYQVRHLYTHASYLGLRSMPEFLGCLSRLVRYRRHGSRVWLQYNSLPDLAVLALCRMLGYSLLVTPHLGSNWKSQTLPALRWLTCALLGLAGGIGLISPTQADEVSLPAAPPRFKLRTFLPQSFVPRSAAPDSKMRLVHAGRLCEGKGTFLFLEVCAALRRAGRPFEAEIIGSSDDATLALINSTIAEHALQDDIRLVGRINQSEMLLHLSAADVLVHLSRIDSFPLIVLESLGCGVFPICKDLPGARLMVETYCGHVVANSNAVEDVATILSTLPLAEMRARAEEASRFVVEDYGWDKCVAAVSKAFEDMASRT